MHFAKDSRFLILFTNLIKENIMPLELEKENRSETLRRQAVKMLERKGYQEIKTSLPDYEEPTAFNQVDTDEVYQPDLTARTAFSKHYFEIIEDKSENKLRVAGKWKLMSKLAEIKNGKFFVLVPHGMMSYTNRLLESQNIKAEVLKLQTSNKKG